MGSNKSLNANCLFTIFPRQIRAENEAQFYQLTRETTADFLKIITEKPLNWIAISTIFLWIEEWRLFKKYRERNKPKWVHCSVNGPDAENVKIIKKGRMKESSDALGSIGAEAFKKAPFLNSSLILRISETCLITATDVAKLRKPGKRSYFVPEQRRDEEQNKVWEGQHTWCIKQCIKTAFLKIFLNNSVTSFIKQTTS